MIKIILLLSDVVFPLSIKVREMAEMASADNQYIPSESQQETIMK